MKPEDATLAAHRIRCYAICNNTPDTAETCVRWAVSEATCELDRDVRILCLQSVPGHLEGSRILRAARETYAFARKGLTVPPDNPPKKIETKVGPGAPLGRRAGKRRPRTT